MTHLMQDIDDHRLELDIFILLQDVLDDAGHGPTHSIEGEAQ